MSHNDVIFQHLTNAILANTPCVLATVVATVNSTSGNSGDKAIIYPSAEVQGWVGGGCVQGVIKKVAAQVLLDNRSIIIRVCPPTQFVDDIHCYPSHCASEGSLDIFLEPIANKVPLLLYGNSPVAIACAKLALELNFSLHWQADDSTFGLFPQTDITRITKQASQFSTHITPIAIIATQGQGDNVAIQSALTSQASQLLLVASTKKATSIREKLQQQGSSVAQISRIISPAGLSIGATGAKEIALSVMAQVLALKNAAKGNSQQEPGVISNQHSPLAMPNITVAASASQQKNCCGAGK